MDVDGPPVCTSSANIVFYCKLYGFVRDLAFTKLFLHRRKLTESMFIDSRNVEIFTVPILRALLRKCWI